MSEVKTIRINKVLRELNISLDRAVEQLGEHGFEIEARPTSKISQAEYQLLVDAFIPIETKRKLQKKSAKLSAKKKKLSANESKKSKKQKPKLFRRVLNSRVSAKLVKLI